MATPPGFLNTLYYGDNLDVLRRYVPDASVDLVYLDPPFNSNADYNVLFAERGKTEAAAQIKAFEDTWKWDEAAAQAFHDAVQSGHGRVPECMNAFNTLLGGSDMLAYLSMMAPRLIELHRVLKPTGSIYLHCDPTASHYLKLLMDAIFGPQQFHNEIIWKRTTAHSDAQRWSQVSDILLFYGRGEKIVWNCPRAPHDPKYLATKYRHTDADGRVYRLDNMTSPHPRPNMTYEWKGFAPPAFGWRYSKDTMARLDAENRVWYPSDKSKRPQLKRYLDENPGRVMDNVWADIFPINSQAQERLGYPTQKPEALLERIINASSNEGDVVLDPFCGCGTAVAVAQKLNRRWLGIDVTHLAIGLIKHRLFDAFGLKERSDPPSYQVVGEPEDLAGATQLASEDKFQFQAWALGLVKARVASSSKKGADKGVDGRLYFHDEADSKAASVKQVILSVKGGGVSVKDVRDLVGVLEREKGGGAVIGAMITLEAPTAPMRKEAASAGMYASPFGKTHARVQLLTVEGLLNGTEYLDMPSSGDYRTFKKAPKATKQSKDETLF